VTLTRRALIGLFLLLSSLIGLSVPASVSAATHPAAKMDRLSLGITVTGSTVWGKVSVRYTYRHKTVQSSCVAGQCQLRIPQGTVAHFSQTAIDSSTWPFSKWQVRSGSKTTNVTKPALSVRVKGPMSVTAVYVLQQQSQATQPPTYGNPYP